MQVNQLKMFNFRTHQITNIGFDKKINVIYGDNGSGKSSVADALAFVYTGSTRSTSKNGVGLNELITFGESRSVVSVDTKGIGLVSRTIPHSFEVKGWEGGITVQENRMFEKLGCTPEQLLCTIYGSKFLEMPPNEQKNFMFSLVGLRLSTERVQREFMTWCQENNIDSAERLWNYVTQTGNFNDRPDEFERLSDVYIKLRKQIKKEIEVLKVRILPVEAGLPEGITVEHRDIIMSQIDDLRKKRDALQQELGTVRGRLMVRQNTERVANQPIPIIPEEKMDELVKTKERLNTEYSELNRELHKLEARIDQIKTLTKKLSNFNGKCPLCDTIDCAQKESMETLHSSLSVEVESIEKNRDDLSGKVYGISQSIDVINQKIDQRRRADIILPDIERAKIELEKMGPEVVTIDSVSAEISSIERELSDRQSLLTKILTAKNAEELRASSQLTLDQKIGELNTIQILIDAFGPKGIRSTMLAKAMRPVEAAINERMAILTHGKVVVNFVIDDEGYTIYFVSDGMQRSVKQLSKSEVLRMGMIIQDAVSRMSKLRFAVFDEVDTLDKKNRAFFWDFIEATKADYDTIIMMVTGDSPKENPYEDVNFFTVGVR
jgi:DNA repair exonuclease SbcCD ATPase subunit